MSSQEGNKVARLAEVVAALSLATDIGMGQPMGHSLRACLLAVRLGDSLGLARDQQHEVYYVALLRRAGCTGDSHELSAWFGDDIGAHSRTFFLDFGKPLEVVGDMLRHAGAHGPPWRRVQAIASALSGGRKGIEGLFRASCEVARRLAERLGMPPHIRDSLGLAFERWDGRGFPNGARHEDVPLAVRVVQMAEDMEVYHRLGGEASAVQAARRWSGSAYDPDIADHFLKAAGGLLETLDTLSPWDDVLAAEPGSPLHLSGREFDNALLVMADFADLKSPWFTGHSRAVADLAVGAARRCRLPDADSASVWRAGLVHDLGRVGVKNSIWEKPGPLSDGEWEQARLHPYYTERVLARSPALSPLGALAAMHHEHLDGSGYHRGLPAAVLPVPARVLAAADRYRTRLEDRPHRPARTPEQAAQELRAEVRAGRLDGDAVAAVLAAAGHQAGRRREWPAGLSAREIEVLRLVARGYSRRQIAHVLSISAHTADHHIRHIYNKTGVSTRAGATVFAMEHGLLELPGEAQK